MTITVSIPLWLVWFGLGYVAGVASFFSFIVWQINRRTGKIEP